LADTGVLVDPENIEEFAGALSNLLSAPQRRVQLSVAGYQRCRKLFDWDVIAKDWLSFLRRLPGR
jgi:glycosyltransferase involved in cell wall biosynthesis